MTGGFSQRTVVDADRVHTVCRFCRGAHSAVHQMLHAHFRRGVDKCFAKVALGGTTRRVEILSSKEIMLASKRWSCGGLTNWRLSVRVEEDGPAPTESLLDLVKVASLCLDHFDPERRKGLGLFRVGVPGDAADRKLAVLVGDERLDDAASLQASGSKDSNKLGGGHFCKEKWRCCRLNGLDWSKMLLKLDGWRSCVYMAFCLLV